VGGGWLPRRPGGGRRGGGGEGGPNRPSGAPPAPLLQTPPPHPGPPPHLPAGEVDGAEAARHHLHGLVACAGEEFGRVSFGWGRGWVGLGWLGCVGWGGLKKCGCRTPKSARQVRACGVPKSSAVQRSPKPPQTPNSPPPPHQNNKAHPSARPARARSRPPPR
jgi:hypothetical protein